MSHAGLIPGDEARSLLRVDARAGPERRTWRHERDEEPAMTTIPMTTRQMTTRPTTRGATGHGTTARAATAARFLGHFAAALVGVAFLGRDLEH
ncbi:hypothetical protein GCM10018963_44960 [Saccharothrix longispora]